MKPNNKIIAGLFTGALLLGSSPVLFSSCVTEFSSAWNDCSGLSGESREDLLAELNGFPSRDLSDRKICQDKAVSVYENCKD